MMKMQLLVLTILLLTFIPLTAFATDVSGDVWGEWSSAGNPYNVIGDLRVPPGSTLVIGPGCYVEFQGYYGLLVDNSAMLQANGIESDSIIFTALDTTTGWNGTIFDHSDSSSRLNYCHFEYAIGDPIGMVVNISYASLNIQHCTFKRNRVFNVIYIGGHAGALMEDNTFDANIAQEILTHFGSLPTYITGNIFELNNSVMLIFHFSDEIIVHDNIFRHNIGLVMYSRWSIHTEFVRNIVYNNFSDELPSVFFGMDADYTIENNTICNNISTSNFFPLAYFETEHVPQPAYMINNIFWGNIYEGDSIFRTDQSYLTVIYCDVQGGWPGGNIDVDPMFVDTANGDYHLLAGSPCIDAGSPFSPPDPDGTIADMGALYFDQTVGIQLPPLLPLEITLHQNYPNPFNAGTKISFTIYDQSDVKINIFDMLGRKVCSLMDKQLQAGEYSVTWDGRADTGEWLSSGVYFYNLKTYRYEDSKKMVILK